MRIAWVGPVSPVKAGQARHSELLLRELMNKASIDLFIDGYTPQNQFVRSRFQHFHQQELLSRHRSRPYDAILYQVANNHYHEHILDLLHNAPGIVDLHEVGLDGLFSLSRGVIRDVDTLLKHATGVITHSQYQQSHVAGRCDAPVAQIPLPTTLSGQLPGSEAHAIRRELGIPVDAFVVASYGFVHPYKRFDVVMRAFTCFAQLVPKAIYLHVGAVSAALSSYWNALRQLANLGAERDRVRLTGWVTDEDMVRYAHCADICMNLRYPTVGEVSATALQCMAAGKPVLVTEVDSFGEIPDQVCIKVPLGEAEEKVVTETLIRLWSDPDSRRDLGARASEYATLMHDPKQVANKYLGFIERVTDSLGMSNHMAGESRLRTRPGESLAISFSVPEGGLAEDIYRRSIEGERLYVRGILRSVRGTVVDRMWLRRQLPIDVQAGGSGVLDVAVQAPNAPGHYLVDVYVESEFAGLPLDRSLPVATLPLLVIPDTANNLQHSAP